MSPPFPEYWLVVSAIAAASCVLQPTVPTPPAARDAAGAGAPVQLATEPEAGPAAVLDLVSGARVSIWMEMYLLTDDRAIAAIAERARAGCEVRVILEPTPYRASGANQAAFEALAVAGADVRWASPRFSYTHAKTFVVDHARLAVLTLNLTGDGLGGNREYLAIDDDPTDVAAAEALFTADSLGAVAWGPAGRLVTSPESSRPSVLALIRGAQASLALETEELTDAEVVSALLAARTRGVSVTLAWPGPGAGAGPPFMMLAAAGAVVRAVAAPPIHAKVAVADDRTLYIGSVNLSPTSLDDNREVGLLLQQPDLAARAAATVAGDAAAGAPPGP